MGTDGVSRSLDVDDDARAAPSVRERLQRGEPHLRDERLGSLRRGVAGENDNAPRRSDDRAGHPHRRYGNADCP